MRFTSLFPIACLLLLAVLSTAWQLDGLDHGQLLPRQDDSESDSDTTTAAESATTGATATADDQTEETTTSTKSSSDSDEEETKTATTTAKATHTGGSSSNSTTTRHSSNTTSIDARLPAGGTSMLTPNAYSTTYYKVMDTLTFVWNYTSLSITPTAVNVVAICTQNSATYTIASNISVEQTQTVTWDTGKVDANATAPLLTATYTLFVYDDTKEVGDTASAGELGSQNGYMFGMYTPQPYTPLNEYVCATCSDALSATDLLGIKMAVGMGLLTVASFTWFAGNFGAFST